MTDMVTAAAPPESPSTRSTADVLAGRIRITLAGRPYVLRVLTIGENEDWRTTMEAELQPLIDGTDDIGEAVRIMGQFSDRLLPFLRSYDKAGAIPPPGDWERDIYPHELLRAVMEVRLAADPTTSYAVAALSEDLLPWTMDVGMTSTTDTDNTSSSRRPTAGRRRKSKRR